MGSKKNTRKSSKKKSIIGIIIAIVLIVGLSVVIYKVKETNDRKYEIAQISQYDYFVLKTEDKTGVIDKEGNTIIDPVYDDIKIPNPGQAVFVCYTGDTIKVLNKDKEEILTQYEMVEPIRFKNIASDLMYEKSVLKYKENGKYGLIDLKGKKITKAIYDELDSLPYKEGELVVKQGDKSGIINIKGKSLVETEYDKIEIDRYYTDKNKYEYAGYIVTKKTEEGYRYGYINNKGKLNVKTEYNELKRITDIEDNENIYLVVAENGQYGVIKNDKKIVNNEYQAIRYDSVNKVLVIEKNKKYGIADLEGKVIVPVEYNQIDITGIYIYAQDEQGTTVYNSNGTQANIDTNVAIIETENEKYKIKINNSEETKYGVINKEGKQLIKEKYNYMEYLFDNYFIASLDNGKLGIVNDKDDVKVEIKYDAIQKITGTDMLRTFETSTNMVVIYDKNMKKICEMQDAAIENMEENIKVYNDTEIKYFNKEGKEINNTEAYPNNKLFAKQENGKWGFVDVNGKTAVESKYDKVTEFNKYGFASVKKDNKWGAINEQGLEVIEPTYEMNGQVEPSFIGKYYQVTYGFGEIYYTDSNKEI